MHCRGDAGIGEASPWDCPTAARGHNLELQASISAACPFSASELPRSRWRLLFSWAWGKVSEWKDLLAGKLAPGEQGGQGNKAAAMPTFSRVAGHWSQ